MSTSFEIRYSNDGGNNWSPWRLLDAGDTGSHIRELKTRRLGFARHRIWEIRDVSNVPADILAASIIAEVSDA